jgi:hypothetical protein
VNKPESMNWSIVFFFVCIMPGILKVSSLELEPLTTLRVVLVGMQCIAKTTDLKNSKLASIVWKGRANRIPTLRCTRIVEIISNGGSQRLVSMGMHSITRHFKISTVLQLVCIEEEQRPLWICILLDMFTDAT